MDIIYSACLGNDFASICYNIDATSEYMSYHLGIPPFSISLYPSEGSGCTTVNGSNYIKTICPDSISTLYFNNPSEMTRSSIECQINLMDKLIQSTGVSAGDCLSKQKQINYNPLHNSTPNAHTDVQPTFESINEQCTNNTSNILCKCCRSSWEKQYLIQEKEYSCLMCRTQHIFSPFSVTDFGPYDTPEQMISKNNEILQHNLSMYNNNIDGFWAN